MKDINWEAVMIATLTAIRLDWPVSKLVQMSREGSDTPASGDTIAQRK